MLRGFALLIGLLAALPAVAGEMTADEARRFVIGKMFNYTCFEGTRGQGRVFPDGSVVGSIQLQGSGQVRYAALPPGTLRVKGEAVCASVRGLPVQPCFNLERIERQQLPRFGLGAGLCLLRIQSPQRPHHHGAKREQLAAAGPAALAHRRQQLADLRFSPERSCRSWWRGHKACPRGPSDRLPRSPPCGRDG